MAAEPGERYNPSSLDVAFDYDPLVSVPTVGCRREIAANRKVVPLSKIGSEKEIPGTVISVRKELNQCVMRMCKDANKQDRIAGENVTIGKGLYGPDDKVYQYTPAAAARHDGTTTGPVTVVLDTSDKMKVKIEGGTSQTFTLTAGSRTMAQIAAEVNATLTDMVLEVDAAGNLNIVAKDIFRSVIVEAVANDAYTLLGWTAATYEPTTPSHDPSMASLLIIVGGNQGAAVEVIEY